MKILILSATQNKTEAAGHNKLNSERELRIRPLTVLQEFLNSWSPIKQLSEPTKYFIARGLLQAIYNDEDNYIVLHHIDYNNSDNRAENVLLMTRDAHSYLHTEKFYKILTLLNRSQPHSKLASPGTKTAAAIEVRNIVDFVNYNFATCRLTQLLSAQTRLFQIAKAAETDIDQRLKTQVNIASYIKGVLHLEEDASLSALRDFLLNWCAVPMQIVTKRAVQDAAKLGDDDDLEIEDLSAEDRHLVVSFLNALLARYRDRLDDRIAAGLQFIADHL